MNENLPLNKILLGDCIEGMKSLPEKCVDLTVTSPPYDNLMEYNGYSFNFEPIAHELFRITKDGGVVVWVIGDATIKGSETGTSFRQALYFKECGFNLHDTMIWHKANPMPSFKAPRYTQAFEYMFIFSKGLPKTFNPLKEKCVTAGQKYTSVKVMGNRKEPTRRILETPKFKKETKNLDNVWKMGHAARNYGHPAVFPEKLVENHIQTWSKIDEIIFDPFTGSGTTPAMALKHNRYFIGCEISKEYVEIANERIRSFLDANAMLEKAGISTTI